MAVVSMIASLALAASTASPPPGQVMLLASYHLANNNRDLVNMPIEDVLAPKRQAEIVTMVDALARWQPTRVAVEWPKDRQVDLDARYAAYRAGAPATANEREQIAFRLATKCGLDHIDAVDWNEDFPGPAKSYDFAGWAKANGQSARFNAFVGEAQAEADHSAAAMRGASISRWYRDLNAPAALLALHRPYFTIATFGDQHDNPGAAWVGGWYARNLRIFGNIRALAAPGERVFVLYGAGHAYLLERDAIESGAVTLVSPLDYLP